MGKTLNHIIFDIKNIATSGSLPNDFRISDNQIAFWIDQYRAMFIAQSIQKTGSIDEIWLQPITCLKLIEVDKSECCEVQTNCKILRTQLILPDVIEADMYPIIRILKQNGAQISMLYFAESRYIKYSKFGNIDTKWYEKDGYIYIIEGTNEAMIENISVYGLWDRPMDLRNYVSCNGSSCYSADTDYPCSMKMAEMITDIVLKKRVIPLLNIPQDTTNNTNNTLDTSINNK